MIGEEIFWHAKPVRIRTYPSQGGLHGFLHDLADLACHGESAFAFQGIGLNEQYVATRWSLPQTDSNSGKVCAFGVFAFSSDFDSTQKHLADFFVDDRLPGRLFRH